MNRLSNEISLLSACVFVSPRFNSWVRWPIFTKLSKLWKYAIARHPSFCFIVWSGITICEIMFWAKLSNVWARHLTSDGVVIWIFKSARLVFRCVESKSAKWLSFEIIFSFPLALGYAVAQLVEALHYNPEDHGFDFRWCYWNFLFTQSFRPQYGLGGWLSL